MRSQNHWRGISLFGLRIFSMILLLANGHVAVEAIPVVPSWQVMSVALNVYGGWQPVVYPDSVHTYGTNDNTCQANAWEWMAALGDQVRAYADEKLNSLAKSLDLSSEIEHYRTVLDGVVSGAEQLNIAENMDTNLTMQSLDHIFRDIEAALMTLFTELEEEFPAPETALGHDERVAKMAEVMARARGTILRVADKHGMSDGGQVNRQLDVLCPKIEALVILTGDLAEQHPQLLEALLLAGSVLIIPEMFFIRPFLGLFGFGPYGPVKGSLAAWAQRVFFGAAVPKGSWFAAMQSAAMKFGPWWRWVAEWLRGLFGIAGSLFAICNLEKMGSD